MNKKKTPGFKLETEREISRKNIENLLKDPVVKKLIDESKKKKKKVLRAPRKLHGKTFQTMSKKDKSKPSPFGLPSFKKEDKENKDMMKNVDKNLPERLRKMIEDIKSREKNK